MTEPGTLEVIRENRSSIELNRSEKGLYRYSVKIYFDADDDASIKAATQTLQETEMWLRVTYCGGQS